MWWWVIVFFLNNAMLSSYHVFWATAAFIIQMADTQGRGCRCHLEQSLHLVMTGLHHYSPITSNSLFLLIILIMAFDYRLDYHVILLNHWCIYLVFDPLECPRSPHFADTREWDQPRRWVRADSHWVDVIIWYSWYYWLGVFVSYIVWVRKRKFQGVISQDWRLAILR